MSDLKGFENVQDMRMQVNQKNKEIEDRQENQIKKEIAVYLCPSYMRAPARQSRIQSIWSTAREMRFF
jgi:hypothetical protein